MRSIKKMQSTDYRLRHGAQFAFEGRGWMTVRNHTPRKIPPKLNDEVKDVKSRKTSLRNIYFFKSRMYRFSNISTQ